MKSHVWLYFSGGLALAVLLGLLFYSKLARAVLGETLASPKQESEIEFSDDTSYSRNAKTRGDVRKRRL
jgi:hypothetical protein